MIILFVAVDVMNAKTLRNGAMHLFPDVSMQFQVVSISLYSRVSFRTSRCNKLPVTVSV